MEERKRISMTTGSITFETSVFEWNTLEDRAYREGVSEFLSIVAIVIPFSAEQWKTQEERLDERKNELLERAKKDRMNSDRYLLSFIRNWSRYKAVILMRREAEGDKREKTHEEDFKKCLQKQIDLVFPEIQNTWKLEDEQRAAAEQQRIAEQRAKSVESYKDAFPYVIDLNDAVIAGARQQQIAIDNGQQSAQRWADKYGESIKEREMLVEGRENRLADLELAAVQYKQVMYASLLGQEKPTFVDHAMRSGGKTLSILFWLIVSFIIVFFLLYLGVCLMFLHH